MVLISHHTLKAAHAEIFTSDINRFHKMSVNYNWVEHKGSSPSLRCLEGSSKDDIAQQSWQQPIDTSKRINDVPELRMVPHPRVALVFGGGTQENICESIQTHLEQRIYFLEFACI